MICKQALREENDKTYRLTGSSISSLGADLGDQDPGLLSDRLGGGQPGLRGDVGCAWRGEKCEKQCQVEPD